MAFLPQGKTHGSDLPKAEINSPAELEPLNTHGGNQHPRHVVEGPHNSLGTTQFPVMTHRFHSCRCLESRPAVVFSLL